ncbi:hypothetical protein FOCC_FOCC017746 [Frankliniella occidentalis]|nr:hypothetical protein FOCC_FOCC017746 [Frankliniella occidentalis]
MRGARPLRQRGREPRRAGLPARRRAHRAGAEHHGPGGLVALLAARPPGHLPGQPAAAAGRRLRHGLAGGLPRAALRHPHGHADGHPDGHA